MTANEPLTTQRLLLCEGVEDAQFFRALIRIRNLGAFDVRWVKDVGGTAGISGFKDALIGSVALSNFRKIKHVCLIADCDNHYGEAFKNIKKQIVEANSDQTVEARFPVPDAPYKLANGSPLLTVLMVPSANKKGALESLIIEAMRDLKFFQKALTCAAEALTCSGADKWQQQKVDKATMITTLAISNTEDPAINLTRLWGRQPDLIPLTHKAFDDIAKALSALKT
ncbi:DUF3226 domain-containing protein [Hyphomicrobium sp.]|uniref:DUF3226 domain-containing protein n=1 Tax=Hyphomicrobium sp. TaxID=82 RepID=UPI0035668731